MTAALHAGQPRPRVAIDLTPLLGTRSGIGVFTAAVAEGLAAGAEFDLVGYAATWRGRHALSEFAPAGVRLVSRPLPARPLRMAWRRGEIPPVECFAGKVELVHGTNFVVPPARRAQRLMTVHDLTPLHFPQLCTRDTLAYPGLVERAWRRGAWIHTVSEFVAAEVREWLGVADADAHRVVAIHNGFTPALQGDPAQGRLLAGGERYVLALGTVEPRKGLVDLVKAFDDVAELDDGGRRCATPVRLVIAGADGWGRETFDAAVAASRHRSRIVRVGWVDDIKRADLLAGAAVLAYPSIYEGFGLPPLEAMSVGVPVVCSNVGPLPEVVGQAARLVSPGDPVGLAAALVTVLAEDAERAQLAEAGRRQAARYSWSACVAGLSGLYRQIIALG